MSRIRKFLLALIFSASAIITLEGFTFDESVLTQCEREHPNDFVARIVCNSRVEEEFSEKKALICVSSAKEAISANKKSYFHNFLNKNADETPDSLLNKLKEIGYSESIIDTVSGRKNQKTVIIFASPINCKTKAKYLFNILFDNDNKLFGFGAWIHYPKPYEYMVGENSGFISDLAWRRGDHLEDIEAAKVAAHKTKEIARLKSEDFARSNLKKDNEKGAGLRRESEEEKSSQRTINALAILVGMVVLIGGCIFIIYAPKIMSMVSRKQIEDANYTNGAGQVIQTPENAASQGVPDQEKINMDEFRVKYPFVQFDVPTCCMATFLSECNWYKDRMGAYPDIPDQRAILDAIGGVKSFV